MLQVFANIDSRKPGCVSSQEQESKKAVALGGVPRPLNYLQKERRSGPVPGSERKTKKKKQSHVCIEQPCTFLKTKRRQSPYSQEICSQGNEIEPSLGRALGARKRGVQVNFIRKKEEVSIRPRCGSMHGPSASGGPGTTAGYSRHFRKKSGLPFALSTTNPHLPAQLLNQKEKGQSTSTV